VSWLAAKCSDLICNVPHTCFRIIAALMNMKWRPRKVSAASSEPRDSTVDQLETGEQDIDPTELYRNDAFGSLNYYLHMNQIPGDSESIVHFFPPVLKKGGESKEKAEAKRARLMHLDISEACIGDFFPPADIFSQYLEFLKKHVIKIDGVVYFKLPDYSGEKKVHKADVINSPEIYRMVPFGRITLDPGSGGLYAWVVGKTAAGRLVYVDNSDVPEESSNLAQIFKHHEHGGGGGAGAAVSLR